MEWRSGGVVTNLAENGIVLLGQVKETGNRGAELKKENEARMRGGVCMWERTKMCKSLLSKKE